MTLDPNLVLCFFFNGGVVSLRNSKQDTVPDSTTEAEYIAALDAAKEAVWIKNYVFRLGFIPSITNPLDVYCDNNGGYCSSQGAQITSAIQTHTQAFHLIREIIERGDVKICRVHTDDNVAHPLTKPLP